MDQQQIDAALDVCYDAIVEPERWPNALHGLARAIGAVCVMFYPQYPGQTLLRMPASPDFRDFLDEFVQDGWWQRDHRADRGWPLMNAGRGILLEEDVTTDEDRRTLPACRDLYPRYDLLWWAALGFHVAGRQWTMPLQRSGKQGAFTRAEAVQMEGIVPHLRRMISISEKLPLGRIGTSLDLLDSLGAAALALDWQGRMIRMNRHAEALLGDGVILIAGRLHAPDQDSDRRLQRLLSAAVAADAVDLSSTSAAVSAEPVAIRRVGRRPLVAEAMPASGLFRDILLQARALVFLTDLAKPVLAAPDRIAAILGLTSAEGRLVTQLVEGHEPADAAERLGISVHTARSQLKSAFAKTDTHRQAELVALAGRITKWR